MNLALWISAGLLAAIFLVGGPGKLIMPKEKIAATPLGNGGSKDFSASAIRAIGVLEILAAVGLVLPAAVDIAPMLVPLAAAGLVLLMAGATILHLRRHELKVIVANLGYPTLAAFGDVGPLLAPSLLSPADQSCLRSRASLCSLTRDSGHVDGERQRPRFLCTWADVWLGPQP